MEEAIAFGLNKLDYKTISENQRDYCNEISKTGPESVLGDHRALKGLSEKKKKRELYLCVSHCIVKL